MLDVARADQQAHRGSKDPQESRFERAFDEPLTAVTRRRYERIAPIYDFVESMMELRARAWRRDLWSRVEPGRVLELGVGTGKNLHLYPPNAEVVAIDISERMLDRARIKAQRLRTSVHFEIADVQQLPYSDGSFNVVTATFLFCSVPNAPLGLHEARRVLKPGGQLLLLEHVLSGHPILRTMMRALDPIPAHLWGAHINRDTVSAVRNARFVDVVTQNLALDVVKRIEARAP
jgi:SAM-dependent methyltransferase